MNETILGRCARAGPRLCCVGGEVIDGVVQMITDRMRVDVTEIEFVEIGEEGVRITFKSGDRKFVGGDEG